MVAGRINTGAIGLVGNPYPAPKHVTGHYTICEVCDDRRIRTLDWNAHKNSKGHRKNEEAFLVKENDANVAHTGSITDWSAQVTGGAENNDWAANSAGSTWNASAFTTASSGNTQGNRGFNGTCYGCNQPGHSKRDCPTTSRGTGCFNCGEMGHNKAECPNPRQSGGGGGRACHTCGEVGHLKSECPQRAQGGGGGGRQCYNCYEYGHSKADCPNPRKILCRNCDSPEHVARDCDKPKDWTRVKCNNCGNMGHGVKKCPEPIKEDANGGGGDWGNATAVPAQGNWGDDSAAPAKGGCDQDEINKASGDWNGDAGVAADTNDFSNGNGENGGGQDWNGDAQDVPQTTW